MDADALKRMIDDDEFDMLSVKPKQSGSVTPDERLSASFREISDFVKEHGREPELGKGIAEHRLAMRLKALREDPSKKAALVGKDDLGILDSETKVVTSLDDIAEDDDLGLLDSVDESLFDIRNVPAIQGRSDPDFIARRTACEDFDTYEPLFQFCQKDLAEGRRKLIPFVESRMKEGDFFVLDGVLFLLVRVSDPYRGNSNKLNRRTYCVFENGTESNALLRSLGKALSENGFAVSRLKKEKGSLFETDDSVNEDDVKTGFIYILKSRSDDERIREMKNLYKIGFSNIPVEERIRNAETEPTYLMAPVSIVSTYECFNFNPQKLEQLLHNFFGSACLNMDVYDANNRRHMPREWFIAPFEIIEQAVQLIINGAIVNYRYDPKTERIVLR